MFAQRDGPAAGLKMFDEFIDVVAKSPPLRRLQSYVLRAAGQPEKAKALREQLGGVDGALDAFVAGISEIQLGHGGTPGAFERAARYLNLAVLTADHPRPLYHFERAHALGHFTNPNGAREAADAIGQLWPNMIESYFWSAFALVAVDPKRAAVSIRKAVDRAPDRWLFWNNLGVYLQADGDWAAARDAYLKVLELHSHNSGALHNLGFVYEQLGDVKKAEDAYVRALAQGSPLPESWANLARIHLDSGRIDEAEKSVAGAIRTEPWSPATQCLLGELQLATGKVPEAIRSLRSSLNRRPTLRAAFHLGRALSRSGDRPGALAAYQEAIGLSPNDAQSHNNLGNLLLRMGNTKKAEEHLRLSIAADPKLPQPNYTLWTMLNNVTRRVELFEHCADWRKRIPNDAEAWSKSAFSMTFFGPRSTEENAKSALPHARRAVQLSQGRVPRILSNVGWVEYYAGDAEAALRTLRTGLALAIEQRLSKRGVQDVIRGAIQEIENATKK